jgi:hypothetical protein
MTREEKIVAIVAAVNTATDVPVLGETSEGKVIGWVASKTLVHLPDRALDAVMSVSDGLSDDEIAMLTDVLTSFVNSAVDIPYVPERVEEMVLRQAVGYLLSKAKEGQTILAV